MKGLNDLMKQAQEMQENLQRMQEEAARVEVTGESGGGLVQVVMTGRHDVRKVTVAPELLSEEKELLEDLLAAAVNDAVRKVEALSRDKMAALGAGFQFPPGFKMPF